MLLIVPGIGTLPFGQAAGPSLGQVPRVLWMNSAGKFYDVRVPA
jgi:hypothetical protein